MSNSLNRLVQVWDRYWFTPESRTRLAIYRIWVYAIILIDVLAWRRGHLRYVDLDPKLYHPIYILNFFNIPAPAPPWLDIVYGLLAVFVFLALIGFKTNFFALLASGVYMYCVAQCFSFGWVHHLHSPLLFSIIVLGLTPSGARLSVDHLLQRLRENHAAQQFIPKITAPQGLTKFAVLFDGQCPLCIRSVTTVDFLDWRGKFVFRDVNDWEQISRDYPGLDQQKSLEEMQVMVPRHGGHEALAGFYAFRKIAQHLPLGMLIWPFMYIPGVPFIGIRVYRFIASRRKRITGGARCSFHACEIPVTSVQCQRQQPATSNKK